jgi:two-component system chemotaxis response regulator CheB
VPRSESKGRIVAVGASAGGLEALKTVLQELPAQYPWPVIVLLHTSADYRQTRLDELLARCCAIPVREALPRQAVQAGVVHVAPAGYHLLVENDLRFSLSVDEKVAYARPSVDVLFESLADACGEAAVGVILTGANEDGAQGLAAIRRAGGLALVQDPSQAKAAQMPQAALRIAGADRVLGLRDIGAALAALAGEKP